MKLLFDENLSAKLVERLSAEFPDSTHVTLCLNEGAKDSDIWDFAYENGYSIVSKDDDFRQRLFASTAGPSLVWLSVGNMSTTDIEKLVRSNKDRIESVESNEMTLLVIQA